MEETVEWYCCEEQGEDDLNVTAGDDPSNDDLNETAGDDSCNDEEGDGRCRYSQSEMVLGFGSELERFSRFSMEEREGRR